MKLVSPAKVNLFLKVLYKRPDGFHALETCFERVSLCDTITLKAAKNGVRLAVTGDKSVPSGPDNLVVRAVELLRQECGVKKGVAIQLEKRIPSAAGLGGGSSNAAATLAGLNRFWKLGLSRAKLLKLAARLGSDVPFFMLDTPFALAGRRGEKLKKLAFKGRFWHCIVKPDFGISTRLAYEGLGLKAVRRALTPPRHDVKMLLHSIKIGDAKRLRPLLINSLEVSLNKRVTTIQKIKSGLAEHGAFGSLMSGSGSSVFGLFRTETQARKAAAYFRKKHPRWRAFVARTY